MVTHGLEDKAITPSIVEDLDAFLFYKSNNFQGACSTTKLCMTTELMNSLPKKYCNQK